MPPKERRGVFHDSGRVVGLSEVVLRIAEERAVCSARPKRERDTLLPLLEHAIAYLHPSPRVSTAGPMKLGADIALAEVFLVYTDFVQPLICAIPKQKRNSAAFLCALRSNPGRKQRVQEEITPFIPIQDIP
jgi:hypothetical protein